MIRLETTEKDNAQFAQEIMQFSESKTFLKKKPIEFSSKKLDRVERKIDELSKK